MFLVFVWIWWVPMTGLKFEILGGSGDQCWNNNKINKTIPQNEHALIPKILSVCNNRMVPNRTSLLYRFKALTRASKSRVKINLSLTSWVSTLSNILRLQDLIYYVLKTTSNSSKQPSEGWWVTELCTSMIVKAFFLLLKIVLIWVLFHPLWSYTFHSSIHLLTRLKT